MWSVAYTDVFQLGLVAIGLAAALPFVVAGAGGLDHSWMTYLAARPEGGGILPPMSPHTDLWNGASVIGWWDVSIMLMFGGIPWNCYFQRVLSCRSPRAAQGQSILSGLLTIAFTAPPLVMGVAAFAYPWSQEHLARLSATPADAMPLLFATAVPPAIGPSRPGGDHRRRHVELQLVDPLRRIDAQLELPQAVVVAVAVGRADGARNPIVHPAAWRRRHRARPESPECPGAVVLHKRSRVRAALPQLLSAIYDKRANRSGSIAAFAVSLVLRVGGGEPLLGIPATIPYPPTVPFRTVAALAGLVVLPIVSRATARWDAPQLLRNPALAES
jgi:high affinity choline transporter 7